MLSRSRRLIDWRAVAAGAAGAAFLVACASAAPATGKKKSRPIDPGDDYFDEDVTSADDGLTPTRDPDSGAFGAAERPSPKDGRPVVDAGTDAGPIARTYCDGPVKAGDLQIDELLLASRAGSGDAGEWVEVRSTRPCWLKLKGLTIESPRGAAPGNVATITEDFELGPKDAFLVAGSADPLKNNVLPGTVFPWNDVDILKNDGDTVTIKLGATVIDTLVYPAFSNLTVGRTLSFPSNCPANVRNDWARWSLSFGAWMPGFRGTPNRANDDVACF